MLDHYEHVSARAGPLVVTSEQWLAVSGSNVYVAGALINSRTNGSGVLFGGSGIAPSQLAVNGAATTSQDILVARYVDNGPLAKVGWAQTGGGASFNTGHGLVLAGANL